MFIGDWFTSILFQIISELRMLSVHPIKNVEVIWAPVSCVWRQQAGVWEDRPAQRGRKALGGFQTSEARPKQLLREDKLKTSCSPPSSHPLLRKYIKSIFNHSCREQGWNFRGIQTVYMFHKGCFCPDVILIIVLRQDEDLWNESGAWGPSILVQSTSRCLIGVNGIRRGVAGGWEANVDLTEAQSHTHTLILNPGNDHDR